MFSRSLTPFLIQTLTLQPDDEIHSKAMTSSLPLPPVSLSNLSSSHASILKNALRKFYNVFSTDEHVNKPYFMGNEQWEAFDRLFMMVASNDVLKLSENIHRSSEQISDAISVTDIYHYLKKEIFYPLSFSDIKTLILKEVKDKDEAAVRVIEPTAITLQSLTKHSEEADAIVGLVDQKIGDMLSLYANRKSVAIIDIANVRIEGEDVAWQLGNVHLASAKSLLVGQIISQVSAGLTIKNAQLGGHEFDNVAIVKFEGCSSRRAFSMAIAHFNRVFAIVRLMASLRLRRQVWTAREYLELPLKQPALLSDAGFPQWAAINPEIDNDFFVALRDNSIYLPVVLNAANITALDSIEGIESIRSLLARSYIGQLTPLDEKIFDALSWFSESLKNFIPTHTIVGMVTGLECLLTDRGLAEGVSDKSISEHFAERGVVILHHVEDKFEDKLATRKQLKGFYTLRSNIVHGQSRNLADAAMKLYEVEDVVSKVIHRIIVLAEEQGFKRIEDLNDYVLRVLLT